MKVLLLLSSRNLKHSSSNTKSNISTIPQITSAYFFSRYFSCLLDGLVIRSLSYNWRLRNAAIGTTNRNFPYLCIFGSKDNSSVQDIQSQCKVGKETEIYSTKVPSSSGIVRNILSGKLSSGKKYVLIMLNAHLTGKKIVNCVSIDYYKFRLNLRPEKA